MDIADLALKYKDYEWLKEIIQYDETISKEILEEIENLEIRTDNFIEYFAEVAEKEKITVRELLLSIKEDTEGLTPSERELYIECNFGAMYVQQINNLLNCV